jgi:hypothetical protein
MLSRVFTSLLSVSVFLSAIAADAQTIIQNERLVNTTLVVVTNKVIAVCGAEQCQAARPLLDAIPVTCPGGPGQVCTLHVVLDAKVSMPRNNGNAGSKGFFQFLIDGATPDLGPTGKNGVYPIEQYVISDGGNFASRQTFAASILATVTNSSSDQHTVSVKIGCEDTSSTFFGCEIDSHPGTMRIDAFEQ